MSVGCPQTVLIAEKRLNRANYDDFTRGVVVDVGKRVLNVGTTWVNLRCVTITWRNVNKFLDGHSATRKVRRKREGPQLERGTATQMDDG